jgi:hypothetical protein
VNRELGVTTQYHKHSVFTSSRRGLRPFATIVALSMLASCDAWTRASGYVIDATGKAVPGATVLLQRDSARVDTTRSDSAGRFDIMSGAHGGGRATAAIRACAPGAQSEVTMVDGQGAMTISGITLLLQPRPINPSAVSLQTIKPRCP